MSKQNEKEQFTRNYLGKPYLGKDVLKLNDDIVNITQSVVVHTPNYSKFGGYEGERDIYTMDIAKELCSKGYRKQEWISVEERLPENDYEKHWKERQRFLVYTEPNGLMYVAKYGYKEYGWWSDGGGYVLDEKNYRKVTHWMPLPQPPKGE